MSCSFLFVIMGTWSKSLKALGWGGVLVFYYSIYLAVKSTTKMEIIEDLFWMFMATINYNIISLIVHLIVPNRGIKNNISTLYSALGDFLAAKSKYFDPDDDSHEQRVPLEDSDAVDTSQLKMYHGNYDKARNNLIEQFSICRESLDIRVKNFANSRVTADMFRYYITADSIFKKLDYNNADYKALKEKLKHSDIMFRIQRIIKLFARTARDFSFQLQSDITPVLDKRLIVGIEELEISINEQRKIYAHQFDSLQLLLDTLKRVY